MLVVIFPVTTIINLFTFCYSSIKIVSTMPTLRRYRIVDLTEQQYAGVTNHAHAANNTTSEVQLPSFDQEPIRLPIADATRNASSNTESDHEEDNDYLDTLLQILARPRSSFGGRHAVWHQQVQQEMVLSSDEESENDSLLSERVRVVNAVQQFQHEMVR